MSKCKNAFDYPTNEEERNIKEFIEKSFNFKPGDEVYWVDQRIIHGLNDCTCNNGLTIATLEDGTKHMVSCPLCELKRKSITLHEPTIRSGIVSEIEFEGGFAESDYYDSSTGESLGLWSLTCRYIITCGDDKSQTAYLSMSQVLTAKEAEKQFEVEIAEYDEHVKAIMFCANECLTFDTCDIKNSDQCPCIDCDHFDCCSHTEESC